MKQGVVQNRLTIDELYDIFETQSEDFFQHFAGDNFKYRNGSARPTDQTQFYIDRDSPLLYRHIVAERLLAAPFDDVDWREMKAYSATIILDLVYSWMYPLVWIEDLESEQLVAEGRVAREMYDDSRNMEVWDRANKLFDEGVEFFANRLPLCNGDYLGVGMLKNIHIWDYITANTISLVSDMIKGVLPKEKIREKYRTLDSNTLRYSIMYIEEQYGGKDAAEILRLLQSEWYTIKAWKAMGIKDLSLEEMQEFEHCLFHGFDMELAEWERKQESSSPQTSHSNPYQVFVYPQLTQQIIDKINAFLIGKDKEHPREIMMPFRAAIDAGILHRPSFKQLKQLFPDSCPKNKSSVSYYTNTSIKPYESQAYKNMVEEFKKLIQ